MCAGAQSAGFHFSNGTKQGGVLSPLLFSRYIRDLINSVATSGVGCNIAGLWLNILAYADDIVLIAPSWRSLQSLITSLHDLAVNLDLSCNLHITVTMVFSPRCRSKLIANSFPQFSLGNSYIQTVSCLGHIISNKFLDDDHVYREIRNMFTRTNVLLQKLYNYCSVSVKNCLKLFKTYCLCLYDVALWTNYLSKSFDKFQSCYNKCVNKLFFGYRKYDSVTRMLQKTGLPSFSTVIHNNNISFNKCWNLCNNAIVAVLRNV